MPSRIEDYAIIGDGQTAALVARDGSIDWLCFPRFDSGACFAALLGTPEHGRWQICPAEPIVNIARRYRPDTLVLETEYETASGVVTLVDCMPPRSSAPDVVRMVVGKRGRVPMRMDLVIRTDYGKVVPWVRRTEGGIEAVAGPDKLRIDTTVEMHGEDMRTVAEFDVAAGDEVPFVLTWYPSHLDPPPPVHAREVIEHTTDWWRKWAAQCTYEGPWREAVVRSLITLKALIYEPTGGIVAAATTSLPERIGGVRNWDYRYCWLRDATFTLYALMHNGFLAEAQAWRAWLVRAVAGDPSQLNIMYGLGGERRLTEIELEWLPGYENSRPVRIGNAAYKQLQLDVFGEVMDSLYLARRSGLKEAENAWNIERELTDHLVETWQEPDEGIWEVRSGRRHFTHSKVMAWVAFDRAIRSAEQFGLNAKLGKWKAARDALHAEICTRGVDSERGCFVQSYGSADLDASLLMIPLVGFLPPVDPRVRATVECIQRDLMQDGFVARYPSRKRADGLPPGEGAFLPCTFWLADNLALLGRKEEATELFERLLKLQNDVGLLSEEYDPESGRLVGNFPQAFTHVGLVNTARNLSAENCPSSDRRG